MNKKLFLEQLSKAIKMKKIWTVNINTTSPRYFTPALLPYHISDWFFAGTPDHLREYLQLDEIQEEDLQANIPKKFNNLIFWRNAQNEQAIWRKCWTNNKLKDHPKLSISQPWINNSLQISRKYALYLNKNYFITAFRKSGLQSTKYKCNFKSWYINPYNLLILGSTEVYLINNGYYNLLFFYIPFMRMLFFYIRTLVLQRTRIRF